MNMGGVIGVKDGDDGGDDACRDEVDGAGTAVLWFLEASTAGAQMSYVL